MSGGPCIAGVNLPTILGAYNHDLAPNERYPDWGCAFSPLWIFRYLAICREQGFSAVRIWLCEDGEGIVTDDGGRPVGVMPELMEAILIAQEGARLLGLRLYWTLLDGNAWQRNGDELTGQIFDDETVARLFAERIGAPIARILDPYLTYGLEIVNEPESLSDEVLGESGLGWGSIEASLRIIREVLHRAQPGVRITAGTQSAFLSRFVPSAKDAPVDAIDLHVYHPEGGLPSRADLDVDIEDLPLWAGECGLSHRGIAGRSDYLAHYLHNGEKLDYRAIFLWKLEGEEHLYIRESRSEDGVSQRFVRTSVGNDMKALLRPDWGNDNKP